jgi:hypothetical protein
MAIRQTITRRIAEPLRVSGALTKGLIRRFNEEKLCLNYPVGGANERHHPGGERLRFHIKSYLLWPHVAVTTTNVDEQGGVMVFTYPPSVYLVALCFDRYSPLLL